MPTANTNNTAATTMNVESACLENVANNLEIILRKTGWTQRKLSEKMGVAPAMMCDYLHRTRLPSLVATLRLVSNTEIQRLIPFTIDQFLNGDIRDPDTGSNAELTWNQEGGIHRDILGTYYLYFFDQNLQKTETGTQSRKFRYGVIRLFETVKKNGGVKVFAFARFFKTIEEAKAFRNELDSIEAPDEERQDKEILLLRSHDDTYSGAVSLIGKHVFIELFSNFYNDKGLIILTAPEKKPGAEYIGGLGNNISITHGAEHVPASQKIILSRGAINASSEEIASHLLYGRTHIEVEGELQALLDLLETFYSSNNEAINGILDDADKRAIIRQRLQQLVNNYIDRTFNGACLVSKQDDHECYQFLKRHVK